MPKLQDKFKHKKKFENVLNRIKELLLDVISGVNELIIFET